MESDAAADQRVAGVLPDADEYFNVHPDNDCTHVPELCSSTNSSDPDAPSGDSL